jgi:Rps23 Pro-64 3,4-dihydroxylase Tpa1-like proline 4-hydroxylase
MNFKKFKAYYSPWTFAVIDEFLNNKEILNLKKEILRFDKFDDKVMGNRSRINKGSSNFYKILKESKNIKNFYKKINSARFYKKIYSLFEEEKLGWLPKANFFKYSKDFFGEQKFSLKEILIKQLAVMNLIKSNMNLDIDFSVSKKGYYRAPHRDRDTRVLSFLLYLNNVKKNHGGSLEIHQAKTDRYNQNHYSRFPKKKEIIKKKNILAKAGRLVIFFSSPDSYHAAEKIKKDKIKRVFIYGSYSLNRKVYWKKKNNGYKLNTIR